MDAEEEALNKSEQSKLDRAFLYRDIRKRVIERLANTGIPAASVETMSLYQIVGLLFLMVGQTNYLGTWTLTIGSLEELVGNQLWERMDTQPEPASVEPTQVVN